MQTLHWHFNSLHLRFTAPVRIQHDRLHRDGDWDGVVYLFDQVVDDCSR